MTTKVTILGASGQIARWVIDALAGNAGVELTLLARDTSRIAQVPAGANVIEGDVTNDDVLRSAVHGVDIVYANLAGDVDVQARHVVNAMTAEGVDRLIFVTALGIYGEVPGEFGRWNQQQIGAALPAYRTAADIVSGSGLNYTLIRPAWLTDDDEVSYETTERDEPFRGTVVSRESVAALIVSVIRDPSLHARADLGIDKPNTDGPRPQFG